MVIIFSSRISQKDNQIEMILKALKDKCQVVVMNPDMFIGRKIELSYGKSLELKVDDNVVHPTTFYLATQWRSDALIRIPSIIQYPNSYRMKVLQMLNDIRFAFEDSKWIPGRLEAIERAESKPSLFSKAKKSGLLVPEYTLNSSNPPKGYVARIIKKNLGFPFIISINRTTGKEVAIVTDNTEVSDDDFVSDGDLWQWQTMIKSKRQVRCFVVDRKIWSVICNRDGFIDLRQTVSCGVEVIKWFDYTLPKQVSNSLLELMESLGISVAAPEFLVGENGDHIFIDMNPCGDWGGFFNESVNMDISTTIAEKIVSCE